MRQAGVRCGATQVGRVRMEGFVSQKLVFLFRSLFALVPLPLCLYSAQKIKNVLHDPIIRVPFLPQMFCFQTVSVLRT
jgi:hypothetical protein